MQRVIIFAIVLSLAALAPTPAWACVLFSPQIAECETSNNQMPCDGMVMQMGVQDDASHLSDCCPPSVTCGTASQSMLSVLQYKSENTVPLIAGVNETLDPDAILIAKETNSVSKWQDPSPPTIQSLLCTFLI